ncbi:S1C family serine protease [Aquipuribacter nitratireducens]|uniref:S1C family serine protease n=1 Tax=Aquipuribacter nitratireducens TaxID=650104 RepID=A0ABW0GML8_9MICO
MSQPPYEPRPEGPRDDRVEQSREAETRVDLPRPAPAHGWVADTGRPGGAPTGPTGPTGSTGPTGMWGAPAARPEPRPHQQPYPQQTPHLQPAYGPRPPFPGPDPYRRQQQAWGPPPSAGPRVDTVGRPSRQRRGGGGVVVVAVVLALVAGLVGGVGGAVLADRTGLAEALPGGAGALPERGSAADTGDGGTDAFGEGAAAPLDGTGSVSQIAAAVLPSVVSILVEGDTGQGTGSGFVIDAEGLVLTNNHVVVAGGSEPADDIMVELSDGSQVAAEVVGTEPSYDVAVLRIDPAEVDRPLVALPFGDSDDVVVGEQVVAVGAPLGLDSTVTTGIVSALNRPVSAGGGAQETAFINAIQTDAAINPGNSGGPLVNLRGEVVGVNSAIAQAPGGQVGGSIGLGFSIPSNQAARTAEQLIEDGVATYPVVGVLLDRLYEGEGVRIVQEEDATGDQPPVTPGGPADQAGLRAGDVILAFEGRPVTESDELVVAIRAQQPGDEVTLTVRRGEDVFDVTVVLDAGEQG